MSDRHEDAPDVDGPAPDAPDEGARPADSAESWADSAEIPTVRRYAWPKPAWQPLLDPGDPTLKPTTAEAPGAADAEEATPAAAHVAAAPDDASPSAPAEAAEVAETTEAVGSADVAEAADAAQAADVMEPVEPETPRDDAETDTVSAEPEDAGEPEAVEDAPAAPEPETDLGEAHAEAPAPEAEQTAPEAAPASELIGPEPVEQAAHEPTELTESAAPTEATEPAESAESAEPTAERPEPAEPAEPEAEAEPTLEAREPEVAPELVESTPELVEHEAAPEALAPTEPEPAAVEPEPAADEAQTPAVQPEPAAEVTAAEVPAAEVTGADEPAVDVPVAEAEPAPAVEEAAESVPGSAAPEAPAPAAPVPDAAPHRSIWAPPDAPVETPAEAAPTQPVRVRSIWAPPGADDETQVLPAEPTPTPIAEETAVLPRIPADDSSQETAVFPAPAGFGAAPTGLSPAGTRPTSTTPLGTAPTAAPAPSAAEPTRSHRREPDHAARSSRTPRRRDRRWVVTGIVAAAVVVLGGLYVGALWLWAERVPPGTTVAGIEIGGLESAEAVAALEDGLESAATDPLPVSVDDKTASLDPAEAGLAFDAQATVDSVTGFGLEPGRLWRQLFGGSAVEPVSTVDTAALTTAIEGVTEQLSTPYVDGTVAFVDGELAVTAPADGLTLDLAAAVDRVGAGWLTQARPIELPTVVDPAVIGQAQLDNAVTQLARPLAEAPVTVAVGGQAPELPVDVLKAAASFVPAEDRLELRMDGQLLADAVLARTTGLLTAASNATFTFENGAPAIVPGIPGTMIDPESLATAVADAATSDRVAEVELVETDPAESTAELEALGIIEVVSEFSTPLTSEPRRTRNITNGASKVNGTLIRPGEEFNLGDVLGPLDAEHGYVQAGAIVNGQHTDAWGGGLSQMSTTTYNAAYFAGFELVEHRPHSEWFSRYPEGRESTLFTPQINLRWVNNTPYGALMQSWVEGGRVWVRVWSTKYFEVESTTSGRSNVRYPTTVYSESPTCESQRAGNPGFTVTVTRRVLLEGVEQSNESWTVTYRPQNAVVCGPPPA